MEQPPVFRMGRNVLFFIITLLSLIWIVLLSIIAYTRWDATQSSLKSFIIAIILTNLLTVVTIPILVLVEFRLWLDAARMFLLLTAHLGVAVVYSTWFHRLTCPPDDSPMCQTINTNLLALVWLIPILLLFYSTCLALLVHIRRGQSNDPVVDFATIERQMLEIPGSPQFASRPRHVSVPKLGPIPPSPLRRAWDNGHPRHPSCIAVGVPTSATSERSPGDFTPRKASWPPSAWTARSSQFAPPSNPPSSKESSASSRGSLPARDKHVSMPMPLAVAAARPGRQSITRFSGNRTSHLSELVAMSRPETKSRFSVSTASTETQEKTKKRLAKASTVKAYGSVV